MSPDEIRAAAREALAAVAPETDGAELDPDVPLREQVDLDSMDFLNYLIGVHERLGVELPEDGYERCATLHGLEAVVSEVANADH